MSVTSVEKDLDTLTMSLTAEFAAPVDAVWQVWADPRKLERWWGPPGFPATFVAHDLTPGGRMHYFMTGPEGEVYHGCWDVLAVDAPTAIELDDAFADDTGAPNPDLPVTRMQVRLSDVGGTTRVEVVSTFASREGMEQVLEMGMEEGMVQAADQIDALLLAA